MVAFCDTTSTSSTAWTSWNDTSTTAADSVWHSWNSTGTTTTTVSSTTSSTDNSGTIWVIWNESGTGEEVIPIADPVEVERNERAVAEAREARKETQKAKDKAEMTAKELLLELIGEKEMKVYEETGRLFVKGKKYDYLVQKRGALKRIEKDKITDFCVHIDRYDYPRTDNVIALKLALENNEKEILKRANNHGSEARPAELPRAACM